MLSSSDLGTLDSFPEIVSCRLRSTKKISGSQRFRNTLELLLEFRTDCTAEFGGKSFDLANYFVLRIECNETYVR
jgi:hypothetical protein